MNRWDILLCLTAGAMALVYMLIIHMEILDEGDTPVEAINLMERLASESVPNYKRIWYARSLLWQGNVRRGLNITKFAFDLFGQETLIGLGVPGSAIPEYTSPLPRISLTIPNMNSVKPWSATCSLDSDEDGYTNGQELGDPCCIWKPGKATAWTFHLSHPGFDFHHCTKDHLRTMPNDEARKFISKIDCDAVRKAGRYVPSDDEFFKWYYAEHFEDVEFGSKIFVRALILVVHALLVTFWVVEKELWRELLPATSMLTSRRVSFLRFCLVTMCSYLFVDLASAFVHAYLDNCSIEGPIVGRLCKAFMFHHYHPRSLSVAPVMYWLSNTLEAAMPVTFIYVIIGMQYQLPREAEVFVCMASVFWPLTYCWHNLAHLPEVRRPLWFQALQTIGLGLSSEAHFVHHRSIDKSWSSMAGIMDFVPNVLVHFFYDRQHANTTFTLLSCLMMGPWYGFFVYYVVFRRGSPSQPGRVMRFWHLNRKSRRVLP